MPIMGREFSTPWLQGPPMSSDHTLSLPYPSRQCPLLPLCFQSLPTIKFSNLFVLITMQNAPPGVHPLQQNTPENWRQSRKVTSCPCQCGSCCIRRRRVTLHGDRGVQPEHRAQVG